MSGYWGSFVEDKRLEREADHLLPSVSVFSSLTHFDESGTSWYKLPGPGSQDGGPGSTFAYDFLGSVIGCRLYKLTISDQAQVILQLRLFLICCKAF